jgi:hypothetical protein
MADHLLGAVAMRRGKGREKIDGFQEIGFALGILCLQEGDPGPERERNFLIISEIPEPNVSQEHLTFTKKASGMPLGESIFASANIALL